MSDTTHYIVPYRVYGLILIVLLVLTGISVAVTQIELTNWSMVVALVLASTKSTIILAIFMHLKFDQKIYRIMAMLIFLLLTSVIIITFLDYAFR